MENKTVVKPTNGKNTYCKFDMQGIEKLCNAIILQAADDYKSALRKQRRLDSIENDEERVQLSVKVNHTLDDVRRFFCSEWFTQLTELDGPSLLKRIHDTAMQEILEGETIKE